MDNTWVKLYRKIEENPHFRNPNYLAVWVWLLVKANHRDRDELLGGKRITCKPGQFTTGRKQLTELSGVNRSTLERILDLMESEHQIEQQKTNLNRLITIVNWNGYQKSEHDDEQQLSNKRATTEQQVSTLQEVKNIRSKENIYSDHKRFSPPSLEEVVSFFSTMGRGDGAVFFDHFTSNGWKVGGKTPMKDWHAAARNWDRRSPVKKEETVTRRATKLQGIPSNPNRIGLTEICPTNSQNSLITQ